MYRHHYPINSTYFYDAVTVCSLSFGKVIRYYPDIAEARAKHDSVGAFVISFFSSKERASDSNSSSYNNLFEIKLKSFAKF